MRRALLAVAVLLGVLAAAALIGHAYVLCFVLGCGSLITASASERLDA